MAGMTIKDIAKKCHVGVSTVSRAMNNHPDINPETKEKILKAIEEANYVPNNSARNLKRNDAKAIAVLVKGIGNTFFSELVGILERECEKKGYSLHPPSNIRSGLSRSIRIPANASADSRS